MGFNPDPTHPANYPPRFGPTDEEMFPEVHNPADPFAFTSHEERFDLRKLVSRGMFANGLFDVKMDRTAEGYMRDTFMAELRATMMGKKLPSHEVTESRTVHVDCFDSPWQHFKANHRDSWWLRRLVRRHPPTTHQVSHTVTLTAKWEQFVGFPWQEAVSHLDPHRDRLGPAMRFASMIPRMAVERST